MGHQHDIDELRRFKRLRLELAAGASMPEERTGLEFMAGRQLSAISTATPMVCGGLEKAGANRGWHSRITRHFETFCGRQRLSSAPVRALQNQFSERYRHPRKCRIETLAAAANGREDARAPENDRLRRASPKADIWR